MAYTPQQRKAHITELQKMLYGLSRYDDRLPEIRPNGIYGRETAFAVKAFQQTRGLRPIGEVNTATWEKLRDEYIEKIGSRAEPIDAYPQNTLNIGLNDEGLAVYIIQAMLRLLSVSYGNLGNVNVTGRYDAATESGVREFQKLSGQPPTGKTDKATWNLLSATARHSS
ncbi:MAG: peptidoglycan-binding protein [Ruminococcus sp.]